MSQFFQTRFVLYDGGCRMCRRLIRTLRYLDVFRATVPYDANNDWESVHAKFPHIDRAASMQDMHVVTETGQTHRGFDAFRSLAWVTPPGWLVLPLLYLPPIPWIGRKIYRRVADNRCSTGACALPEIEARRHEGT